MPTAAALPSTPRCELGESPRWDSRSGRLYWIDIPAGAVHSLDPNRGTVTSRSIGRLVSAIVPYADVWLVGVESGAQVRDREFALLDELVLPIPPAVRMNDGAVDGRGHFFLGSLASDDRPGAGQLFRIDPDGAVTCVLSGLDVSNGICWSPDGTRMFHTDSGTRVIRGYAYDDSTGSLGPGEVFYQHPDDGAVPDGIAVDADGGLWVALWDGARSSASIGRAGSPTRCPSTRNDLPAWRSAGTIWPPCSSPRRPAACRIRATATAGCTRCDRAGRAWLRTRSRRLR